MVQPIGISFLVDERTALAMTDEEFAEFWQAYGKITRIVALIRKRWQDSDKRGEQPTQ